MKHKESSVQSEMQQDRAAQWLLTSNSLCLMCCRYICLGKSVKVFLTERHNPILHPLLLAAAQHTSPSSDTLRNNLESPRETGALRRLLILATGGCEADPSQSGTDCAGVSCRLCIESLARWSFVRSVWLKNLTLGAKNGDDK